MTELSLLYEPCPAGGHVVRRDDGTWLVCGETMDILVFRLKNLILGEYPDAACRPCVIRLRRDGYDLLIPL